jgi:rhamnogalacturonan acetylesterase
MSHRSYVLSLASFLAFIIPLSAGAQTKAPAGQKYPPINQKLPTFWIIGDSTVRNGHDGGENGQWGWGHPIASFFDTDRINVQNRAMGGTSSRTFQRDLWPAVLQLIKPGDYLIMQFGHNDSGKPDDPARARASLRGNGDDTVEIDNPITKRHETVYSYGWYIRKFISDAKAKGAKTVFVCSPIPRNSFKDGKVGRNTTYTPWASEAAKQGGADFIDLNAITGDKYDRLGQEYVVGTLFPDHEAVHTDWQGAIVNAQSVVEGIKAATDSDLASYLLATPPTDFPLPGGKAR